MKNILFVFTANIARSPIAAALFNKKMDQLGLSDHCYAQSVGTWGKNGNSAAEQGIRVMQERDLDISSHRSREVTPQIINSVDHIFTMEAGHKEALQIEFPHLSSKILMFTEMIGPGYDIDDPYGKVSQYFEEIIMEMDYIIEQGINQILRLVFADFFEKSAK